MLPQMREEDQGEKTRADGDDITARRDLQPFDRHNTRALASGSVFRRLYFSVNIDTNYLCEPTPALR